MKLTPLDETSIQRAKALHWYCDADLLGGMASWWLQLLHADKALPVKHPVRCRTEVRIWGLPRHELHEATEILRSELAAFPGQCSVEGADWLIWRDDWQLATSAWSGQIRGIASTLLANPKFQGLTLSLRLTLEERSAEGKSRRGNTLVCWGRIMDYRYALQSLWPLKNWAPGDSSGHLVRWPEEEEVLREIEQVRGGGTVTTARPLLFPLQSSTVITRLVVGPLLLGERDLKKVAASCLGTLTTAAICLLLIFKFHGIFLLLAPLAATCLAILFFVIGLNYKSVRGVYRMRRDFNRRFYDAPLDVRDAIIGPEAEPTAHKFSADIEAYGAVVADDYTVLSTAPAQGASRMFIMPDGCTTAGVLLLTASDNSTYYPARGNLTASTAFDDGYRVTTSTAQGSYISLRGLYRMSRQWVECPGVEEFLAYHGELVKAAMATGRKPVAIAKDDFRAMLIEDHAKLRPHMRKLGYYTMEAAFRYVFNLTRPEDRKPRIDLEALKNRL